MTRRPRRDRATPLLGTVSLLVVVLGVAVVTGRGGPVVRTGRAPSDGSVAAAPGQRPTVQQGGSGQPAGDRPAVEQPTGERPTGGQPTGGQPTGGQPTGAAAVDRGAAEATAQAQAVLDRRTSAVQRHDLRAWLADVDPHDAAFRRREAATFRAMAAVSVTGYSQDLAGAMQPARMSEHGVWVGTVRTTAGIAGVDAGPGRYLRTVRMRVAAGRGWLLDPGVVSRGAQPWEVGLGAVVRGAGTVVAGPAGADRGPGPAPGADTAAGGEPGVLETSAGRLRQLAAVADSAVLRVRAVWGGGPGDRVLVSLPRSVRDAARMLAGGDPRALAQIAAVTTRMAPAGRALPLARVVLNPGTVRRLGVPGLAALLRHEITHVVAGTGRARVPLWLSEGFADYVAFRGVTGPRWWLVKNLVALARSRGVPRDLPTDADFAATSPGLAAAYEGGWLAVRLLVDQRGERAVVRAYRLAEQRGTAAALGEILHTTAPALRASWRGEVSRLARR